MTSFWARKLAERNPPPPPRPVNNPNRPWWSSAPPPQPAQPPVGITGVPMSPSAPTGYTGVPEGAKVITPADINLRRFQSLHQADGCPDCQSPNYFGATPAARKRCFDCGYPIIQSTSGVSNVGASGGAAGTPARQAARMTITDGQGHVLGTTEAASGYKGQSNYNPQNPVAGRIS
jgi:hypothetical protein